VEVDILISGFLNDLWKYNGEEWIWMSGSNELNQYGIYGESGVPNSNNIPCGREGAVSWMDNSGNMWLFGRNGLPSNRVIGNAILRSCVSPIVTIKVH
jgi:hypothetical protein